MSAQAELTRGASPGLIHLSTMYAADESKPGYFYSGSRARTEAVMDDLSEALGGRGHLNVRMGKPFGGRPPVARGVLELRFSIRSALVRVPLGGAGKFSKRPLPLLDYMGNGFDTAPLREALAKGGPSLAVFDHLSSFAYLGWKGHRGRAAKVVYLSHDYEPEFVRERYLAALIRKRIDFALKETDLLVASSERDRLSYLSHGTIDRERVLVYPNIFPPSSDWRSAPYFDRSSAPFTLAMVETAWLGGQGSREDADLVRSALGLLPPRARVRILAFGESLAADLSRGLPGSAEVRRMGRVPERGEFLTALSAAHAGVNVAHWSGGTNVKKYDYALAGLMVLSNPEGARGGLIPHERVFTDGADLAAKILELMDLGSGRVVRMGRENAEAANAVAREASATLSRRAGELMSGVGAGPW